LIACQGSGHTLNIITTGCAVRTNLWWLLCWQYGLYVRISWRTPSETRTVAQSGMSSTACTVRSGKYSVSIGCRGSTYSLRDMGVIWNYVLNFCQTLAIATNLNPLIRFRSAFVFYSAHIICITCPSPHGDPSAAGR